MPECPICGLGERCRNHWVAVQEPNGEVEFQVSAMTASEDNLILLRNKLKNPPLRTLFEEIQLTPEWVEEQGRVLAYLHWPLDLRGAVHRTLFPAGSGSLAPLPPTPIFNQHLEDIQLSGVELDAVNCLPDELVYRAEFSLGLRELGAAPFAYVQTLWAAGVEWAPRLSTRASRQQAEGVVRLLIAGLLDPLREMFAGRDVLVLSEEQPNGLKPGVAVDEIALPGTPERHLGEEIENLINERRLQPMLRNNLLLLLPAAVQ